MNLSTTSSTPPFFLSLPSLSSRHSPLRGKKEGKRRKRRGGPFALSLISSILRGERPHSGHEKKRGKRKKPLGGGGKSARLTPMLVPSIKEREERIVQKRGRREKMREHTFVRGPSSARSRKWQGRRGGGEEKRDVREKKRGRARVTLSNIFSEIVLLDEKVDRKWRRGEKKGRAKQGCREREDTG